MIKKIYFPILLLVVLCGCSPSDLAGLDKNNIEEYGNGVCELWDSQKHTIICEDVNIDQAGNRGRCSDEVYQYSSKGVTTSNYVYYQSTHSNEGSTCNNYNPVVANTLSGTCIFSDRTINYFAPYFTSDQAQVDCVARGGTWP